MKSKKIIFISLISVFIFIIIFTFNNIEAATLNAISVTSNNVTLQAKEVPLNTEITFSVYKNTDDLSTPTYGQVKKVNSDNKGVATSTFSGLAAGGKYLGTIRFDNDIESFNFTTPFSDTEIEGVCGSSDGKILSSNISNKPTTGLCLYGIPTNVNTELIQEINRSSFKWNWECIGINGGRIDSCSTKTVQEERSLTSTKLTSTSVDLIATGLTGNSAVTVSVGVADDLTPSYYKSIEITPNNGKLTVKFSGLSPEGTYAAVISFHEIILVNYLFKTPSSSILDPSSSMFSCTARVDTRADTATVAVMVEDGGNLQDYKIGVLQTSDQNPTNANFNSVVDISGDKLLAMYHLSLLERGVDYRVQIFGKAVGRYIIELPNCKFTTPVSVDGTCGSAKGQSFDSKPTSNLCSTGTPSSVSEVGNTYLWRCNGQNGSTALPASCSASIGSSSSSASSTGFSGLVPRCNVGEIIPKHEEKDANGRIIIVPADFEHPCDFNYVMMLINKIINFLLFTIATPLAALVFAYTGFLLITAGGDPGKMTKAKGILKNVIIGYIIALAAWLIVSTILHSLGYSGPWFLTK